MAVVAEDRSLAEIAQQIALDLGKLATGLAHAGADPQAISGLHNMAQMVGHLATALGQGPVGGQPAMGQPAPGGAPGGAPGPGEGAPQPGGPPAQATAPAGPAPHPGNAAPGAGFHASSAELQARLAAAHAKAQQNLAAA